MEPVFLSVVIPAYNEERRIRGTLERLRRHLLDRGRSWEILVVDDGSGDGTAAAVEGEAGAGRDPRFRLLRRPHRGKGEAVRAGMLAARGEYRFLCDADLSMPVEQMDRFLPPVLSGFDAAVASREAPGSRRIGEPAARHWLGRGFNLWVRLVLLRGIRDTQCGFKCFDAAAAKALFPRQRIRGWAFDVEILFLARRLGMRVVEVPIDWHYRRESKVRPLPDAWRMFRDVLRIRANQILGRYRGGHPAP